MKNNGRIYYPHSWVTLSEERGQIDEIQNARFMEEFTIHTPGIQKVKRIDEWDPKCNLDDETIEPSRTRPS